MKNITLNLTPNEAKALKFICGHIGGNPSGTRGLFDSIDNKLINQYHKYKDEKINLQIERSLNIGSVGIYFVP